MFNTIHILYMVISAIITSALLVLFHLKARDEEQKIRILRFFAIITVVIHISSLWVDFFKTGEAIAQSVMLLPIHPCNVCMWLLVIVSFYKDKRSIVYKLLSEFTFWAGTVCGSIGIIFNENFASNPTLADYDVLKGMLSHSTMLLGCIYLLVSGFVRIRVSNVISVVAGLTLFVIDGAIINALYSIFDLPPCNSMYLLEVPFANMPWLNTLVIGIIGSLVCFAITAIYETITLPSGERWYHRLFTKSEKPQLKSKK